MLLFEWMCFFKFKPNIKFVKKYKNKSNYAEFNAGIIDRANENCATSSLIISSDAMLVKHIQA